MSSSSSDRKIAAARKVDQGPRTKQDTLPSPPPDSSDFADADATADHDTIPTPAPEAGSGEVVAIPPHRRLDVDETA
jgi:hypothetical protein